MDPKGWYELPPFAGGMSSQLQGSGALSGALEPKPSAEPRQSMGHHWKHTTRPPTTSDIIAQLVRQEPEPATGAGGWGGAIPSP